MNHGITAEDMIIVDNVSSERMEHRLEHNPFDDMPENLRRYMDTRDEKGGRILESLDGIMFRTLLFVASRNTVIKTALYENVSRCGSMRKRVEILEDKGLIKVMYPRCTNYNVLMITEKGRKVAELIRELVDVINDDTEGRS